MSTAESAALASGSLISVEENDHRVWRAVLRSGEGRLGLILAVVSLAIIVFGGLVAPYDPTDISGDAPASGPSAAHLLGTDAVGRDVLSRVLHGGTTVFVVPLVAVVVAYSIGGVMGLLAGYLQGRYDASVRAFCDLLLTLPQLLLILVLIATLGTSPVILALSVAVVMIPRVALVVRAATVSTVANDYVAAAEARGERSSYVVAREIVPNIIEPLSADFSLRLTHAIVFVSSLGFLGLGIQPPTPDWGVMIAENRGLLTISPWASLAPAACIAILAVSFNLIADAMGRHPTHIR